MERIHIRDVRREGDMIIILTGIIQLLCAIGLVIFKSNMMLIIIILGSWAIDLYLYIKLLKKELYIDSEIAE